MKEGSEDDNREIWIPVGIVVVAAIAGWLILPEFLSRNYSNVSEKGSYGDSYGSVNTLFTALAFVGIVATIFLQRKELQLQRRELELTREELKGQKEQLQSQSETLKRERFESTFFELLRLHNEIVSTLYYNSGGNISQGHVCIQQYLAGLRNKYIELSKINIGVVSDIIIDKACEYAANFYRPHLGHYFRQLYHTARFIDNGEIENKQLYAEFIQAQLSNDELVLLAYYGISRYGRTNFKPLIEQYGLLENISPGTLVEADHAKYYSEKAFGPSPYRHEK